MPSGGSYFPVFLPKLLFVFIQSLRLCFILQSEQMPSSKRRFLVEYAKSNRSTCHFCRKKIPFKAPRLGFLYRESTRGHWTQMWYHFDCPSHTAPPSPKFISGFYSLQRSDQEALANYLKRRGEPFGKRLVVEEDEVAPEIDYNAASPDVGEEEVAFSINDAKPKYKDAILPSGWKSFETVIFNEGDGELRFSDKIAAFDFEGCLANESPRGLGAEGWSLKYPSIPQKLKALHSDGYKLVIFTNEWTIEAWKKRQIAIDLRINRLESFMKHVDLPIQVFVACKCEGNDVYWKPRIGMWVMMKSYLNSNVALDVDSSFIVGATAGRCGGKLFAERVGLKFYQPEEIFY